MHTSCSFTHVLCCSSFVVRSNLCKNNSWVENIRSFFRGGASSPCVGSCICPCVFAPMCVHQRGTPSRQCCCRWGWGAPWWATVAERPALIKGPRRRGGGGRGEQGEQQAIQKREEVKQACRMGDLGTMESLSPQWDPSRTKRKHLLLCYQHTGSDGLEYVNVYSCWCLKNDAKGCTKNSILFFFYNILEQNSGRQIWVYIRFPPLMKWKKGAACCWVFQIIESCIYSVGSRQSIDCRQIGLRWESVGSLAKGDDLTKGMCADKCIQTEFMLLRSFWLHVCPEGDVFN